MYLYCKYSIGVRERERERGYNYFNNNKIVFTILFVHILIRVKWISIINKKWLKKNWVCFFSYACDDGQAPGGSTCLDLKILQFIYHLRNSTKYAVQVKWNLFKFSYFYFCAMYITEVLVCYSTFFWSPGSLRWPSCIAGGRLPSSCVVHM